MIPKIIHYCWFGGNPLSELAKRCIDSWKIYCPGYEIWCWNEDNVDINENSYIKEAYDAKKWAFITDYLRLKVLYHYGGIYMDTDVEVCAFLDEFLHEKGFSGFERSEFVPTGIMACEPKHPFYKKLLAYYDGRHFKLGENRYDMKTNTVIITEISVLNGLKLNNKKQTICGMTYYPSEYFCPKDHDSGEIKCTNNTACIHHFDGSWHTKKEAHYIKVNQLCNRNFGPAGNTIFKIYKYILHPQNILIRVAKGKGAI